MTKQRRSITLILLLAFVLIASSAWAFTADDVNKAVYAPKEAAMPADYNRYSPPEVYERFGWYVWEFDIAPALDAVGTFGDGKGKIYFRLFVPEVEEGKTYPVVLSLGGLGSSNSFIDNGYARYGAYYANAPIQKEYPSYVLTFNVPFEACTNYEAECMYIYQIGEIVRELAKEYGNVDMNRIYATGLSQGAGWSYELAAVQPDLLAGILIDAGTTVHTTWGDQCDMKAIADSGVNIYILHGYNDQYIPVNEAYRVFNTLTKLGKKNILMRITNDTHGIKNIPLWSGKEATEFMKWLLTQKKDTPCTDEPVLVEDGEYSVYRWAGVGAYDYVEDWRTAHDYAHWTEPKANDTWQKIKAELARKLTKAKGGTGSWHLARFRIGDELQTTYDDDQLFPKGQPITINKGDVLAITIQGYTGSYGDDYDAFMREWSVDWAVLKGNVTNIEIASDASPSPVVRPATVSLANGGGPNINNSLYTWNAIDGRQVYIRVDTADDFDGEELEIAFRLTRTLGNGEYASYMHMIRSNVK